MADPVTMAIVGATAAKSLGDYASSKHAQGISSLRAKAAKTRAAQVSAAHTNDLNMTLDTIRAIRASSGVGANSPTQIAVERKNIDIATKNRIVAVGNERIEAAQARQDEKFQKRLGYINLATNLFSGGRQLATA